MTANLLVGGLQASPSLGIHAPSRCMDAHWLGTDSSAAMKMDLTVRLLRNLGGSLPPYGRVGGSDRRDDAADPPARIPPRRQPARSAPPSRTNFLGDIDEDLDRTRVDVPQADLRRFRVDLQARADFWVSLLAQVRRRRWPMLPPRSPLPDSATAVTVERQSPKARERLHPGHGSCFIPSPSAGRGGR